MAHQVSLQVAPLACLNLSDKRLLEGMRTNASILVKAKGDAAKIANQGQTGSLEWKARSLCNRHKFQASAQGRTIYFTKSWSY